MMRWRGRPAAVGALAMAFAAGLAVLAALITSPTADAQEQVLRAGVAAWRISEGTIEFCIDVDDLNGREVRLCPDLRELNVEAARERRWYRTRGVELAENVSLWVRARRVGDRLDVGLGLRSGGQSRGFRARSWFFDLDRMPTNRWQRTSVLRVTVPVATHTWLWAATAGIVDESQRLVQGFRAPDFVLPRLLGDGESLVSLSEVLAGEEHLTLIVFWASWAPYVSETLSILQEIASESSEVRVVAINVYELSGNDGPPFAREHGLKMLHLVDESGAVAQHYRVDGLPELYVIDWRGAFLGVIRGAAPIDEILASEYGIE